MTNEELLIATAVASWKQVSGRVDQVVAGLTEEKAQREIAPGKNRMYYLVGHLVAVNDRMFPMLGLGVRMHPELEEAFLSNPDRAVADPLSLADLKAAWSEVNVALTAAVGKMTAAEWLQRHSSVSEEDFAKEPLRNRLAVFLSRTNHLGFHAGQMVLVK